MATSEAHELLQLALKDLRAAKILADQDLWHLTCFHAQQAAEKGLKAVLASRGTVSQDTRHRASGRYGFGGLHYHTIRGISVESHVVWPRESHAPWPRRRPQGAGATPGRPRSLRSRDPPGYTVPAHCSSVAAVVATVSSTKVVWAA